MLPEIFCGEAEGFDVDDAISVCESITSATFSQSCPVTPGFLNLFVGGSQVLDRVVAYVPVSLKITCLALLLMALAGHFLISRFLNRTFGRVTGNRIFLAYERFLWSFLVVVLVLLYGSPAFVFECLRRAFRARCRTQVVITLVFAALSQIKSTDHTLLGDTMGWGPWFGTMAMQTSLTLGLATLLGSGIGTPMMARWIGGLPGLWPQILVAIERLLMFRRLL